ncbi:hypothetical protein I6E18_13345 [Phocaeicola barnesiae]|uniref:DUF4988 domain-containing protein n=1 Tax=Phocaeicola barnesiae TaxID=376804 RepID=UPI001F374E59|nr:DUF4988 domain-containing protein [Phocaeicola barnesiae]MCF2577124.1 hypothetical protein [Phocaeicola barnesiae]
MRKKYLSALLFGALLFASAGTFTSCKDYDDDINNLQEQINTVKTSLDELSEKINSLGAGVTDFKYEGGKLILSTDKGTNFEVTLPEDKVGITTVEVKDGYLWIDGVKGDAIATEGEAIDVKVDENGILYINGEAQDLKDEVGSKVIMVDNNNGTYTLTVDGASYVLPKASAAVSISISDAENTTKDEYSFFTNLSQTINSSNKEKEVAEAGGILWGTADQYKGNWKGLKSVEKGQLLVGQIKTLDVKVSPATFDLKTVKLSLVNTLGEEAPVTVNPVAEGKEGPATGSSRAADANGNWTLKVEMKNTVTKDNIADIFAKKESPTLSKNIKYALAVDGKVVTDYCIFIDTDEETAGVAGDFTSTSFNNIDIKFNKKGDSKVLLSNNTVQNEELPLGTTELYIDAVENQTAADKVYDAYIEIVDQNMADAYGIEVSGMTITASQAAGNLTEFPIKIHVLDVNGNESVSDEYELSFAQSTESGTEIGVQTWKVMPTSVATGAFVLVDLGETFTSLSAEDAHKISNMTANGGAVKWYTTIDTKTFATESVVTEDKLVEINVDAHPEPGAANKIHYYASKEDAFKDALSGKETNDEGEPLSIDVDQATASTIKTIKYAAIPVSAFKTEATAGANDITIIMSGMKDGRVNEIKRATTTLTVQCPEFDDVLDINNTQKLWNEAKDTYTVRFDVSVDDERTISLQKPFKSKVDSNNKEYFNVNAADGKLFYELKYTDFNKKVQLVDVDNAEATKLDGKIVSDDHELLHEIEVTSTLYPFGKKYLKNFKVTKTFKLYVQSVFEGAKLVYYVADNPQDVVTLGNNQYIEPGYTTSDGKKHGLYVAFDGEERPYVFKAQTGGSLTALTDFNNGTRILESSVVDPQKACVATVSNDDVKPNIYLGEGASGVKLSIDAKIELNSKGDKDYVLFFDQVPGETSGTVVFNFMDIMGVKYPVTVSYKK